MRTVLVVVVALLAGCHPRISLGYDTSASTKGPLANLQTIPRVAPVTGALAPVPPEGRNYSLGIGFGDKNFTIGPRIHANNVSGSTRDVMTGPQYLSAAAALDFRYNFIRYKGFATTMMLAPSRTILVDSASGDHSWGSGVRYGGGLSFSLSAFSVYADAYQEKMVFVEGPAQGNSTRTGVTLGIAFQP